MQMRTNRTRPYLIAGACGILIVAALYGLPALLGKGGWPGVAGFPALLLPGARAAHLGWRGTALAPLREGTLAGLVTSAGAAALEIWAFVAGVGAIDWATYSAQVGPEAASEVRGALEALTVIGVVLALVICFVGCSLAGWIGSLVYVSIRGLLVGGRRTVQSGRGGNQEQG